MPNQLHSENSPYLLQHVDNPVDWYPWGESALKKAKKEDKPILLSIGYAACHWCHVMAHESFEDEKTAAYMNEHFVNIKVDREERPDIDAIYMNAVVALTGQGGWPMTVFLTPDGRPFYGGTYFPPAPRFGMPSFIQLMQGIVAAWQNQRDEVEKSAAEISGHLSQQSSVMQLVQTQSDASLEPELFTTALNELLKAFDSKQGGFGQAPKFPPSMTIEFLLRHSFFSQDGMALHMAEFTLKKMAYGGMYDQLGGGFSRYSVDNNWLVPHFEKMLYDNALLSRVYLHAFKVTGNPLYKRIVEETLDFVIRELRHKDGGFYSSYDADSEGEEGKFYVWQADEIDAVLGDEATLFKQYYDVTEQGNWEGSNILNIPVELEEAAKEANISSQTFRAKIEAARKKLFDVRARRIWPGLDDKVLTAWNGLMLASFAEAGRYLNRADYTAVAIQNATFLHETMRQENGRLLRTWKAGNQAKYNAYLEDYAYLADGLLALYQTTFNEKWFSWAQELADLMLTHFPDVHSGGFFDTSDDHEQLINRPKDLQDNATPSANSMAAMVFITLGLYTGNHVYLETAETMIISMTPFMTKHPNAFAHWLSAASFISANPLEVAIIGDQKNANTEALVQVIFAKYRPNLVVALGESSDVVPLLRNRPMQYNQATAYVCQKFVCQRPVNNPEELQKQLR